MPIRVLLADDSDVMRDAVAHFLERDLRIEVVGAASSFAQVMQMTADFKPEILLMDLSLPERMDFAPDFVKSQLATIPTVAMSISNDDEARGLAASYGVVILLDKMNLYEELVPAILKSAARNLFRVQADAQRARPLCGDGEQV